MHMTNEEYKKFVDSKSPKSPMLTNVAKAFVSGGLICVIGQALTNMYKSFEMVQKDAAAATSITLVFLGALFTGLKLYDKLAKYCGAGTLVPITGFANSVVSPALEFKSEGYILGTSAKIFTIAGPVIVFGICASVIYGMILKLVA